MGFALAAMGRGASHNDAITVTIGALLGVNFGAVGGAGLAWAFIARRTARRAGPTPAAPAR